MSIKKPTPDEIAATPEDASAPDHDGPVSTNVTGRVKFDERGNAVWEWAVKTGMFGAEVSTSLLKKPPSD